MNYCGRPKCGRPERMLRPLPFVTRPCMQRSIDTSIGTRQRHADWSASRLGRRIASPARLLTDYINPKAQRKTELN